MGTSSGTQSAPESVLGPVPNPTETVSVVCRQTASSRSPGVSPKSSVSSDRLSQDTSSSAVTVDYDEEERPPADLKVLVGRSLEPTVTDEQMDGSPDSSMCDSSPFDEGISDRLESENDEDRKKTTSGVQLNGVQSAATTNADRFLVDQTSADVDIDYTVTQEDVEHKTGEVGELEEDVVSGTSAVVGEQTREPPVEHRDGEACSSVFDGACAVQTLDMTHHDSAAVDRTQRTSVVVTRRRRNSKPTHVLRGGPANQVPNKSKDELAAHGVVSSALQNGIKQSLDEGD